MVDNFDALAKALAPNTGETAKTYTATVSYTDGEGVIWVRLPGAEEDTPTASTSAEVKMGDEVTVEWRNNKLYIAGNYSDPSAGVVRVASVETATEAAQKTADTATAIATATAKVAGDTDQHFWFTETGTDTGAHITEVTQEEFLADPTNGGSNLLARSNGIAIREGTTELSTFTSGGVQIGQDSETHTVIDYHSLQLVDKEGNTYFHVSDLRDANGLWELTETFTEWYQQSSETGRVKTAYEIDTVVSAESDGTELTEADYEVEDDFYVYFYNEPPLPITVTYKTGSELVKAFTFGVRDTSGSDIIGPNSFVSGGYNVASGQTSHAEGELTRARGRTSHAEGSETVASGEASHAEGSATIASGYSSHTEGQSTQATAHGSHAEGKSTRAQGRYSHAEGYRTEVYGYDGTFYGGGLYGHAEGRETYVSGNQAHAQNFGTKATSRSQTALGEFNEEDTAGSEVSRGTYAVIVGNGTDDNNRSNALTVDWNGNLVAGGHVSDGYGNVLGQGGGGGGPTFDQIYPVGSIYMSINATNPGTLFGGTWVQIEDTFLLAAGTNHAAGSTGGSEDAVVPYHRHSVSITSGAGTSHSHGKGTLAGSTPKLTVDNRDDFLWSATTFTSYNRQLGSLPSGGDYNYLRVAHDGLSIGRTAPSISAGKTVTVSGSTANESAHTHSVSGNTDYAGTSGNATGANMPPYLAVYVWQRTA